MSEPIRLAVVGCGGIAQAYLQALGRVPALQLAATVDVDAARAKAAAAPANAKTFADTVQLLDAMQPGRDLHAALVLTPPNTHEDLATSLLGAGVHVLCEKPLAVTVDAAKRMLGAAKEAGR